MENEISASLIPKDEGIEELLQLLDREVFAVDSNQLNYLVADILVGDVSKEDYFKLVYLSVKSEKFARVAANAITVLNYARVPFSGMDLSGIRIPRANLRYAIMDRTNLESATLNDVILADAFLGNANLENAHMEGVDFIQKPFLPGHGKISSIVYDPKHEWVFCATEVGVDVHGVQIVDVSENKRGDVVSYAARNECRNKDKIISLVFIEEKNILACLVNMRFGDKSNFIEYKLNELPTRPVALSFVPYGGYEIQSECKCLAVNEQNSWIAIGSFENVDIYDVNKRELINGIFLEGSNAFINSVCFSKDGQYLACVTDEYDSRLYVYYTENLELYKKIKIDRGNDLTSVQFSPDDQWLAIGAIKGFVSLIETRNWQQRKISFDEGECYNLCFSPDGEFLLFATEGKISKIYIYSLQDQNLKDIISINAGDDIAGLQCEIRNGRYEVILADKSGKIRFFHFDKIALSTSQKSQQFTYYFNHFRLLPKQNILAVVAHSKIEDQNNFLIFKDLIYGNMMDQVPLDFTARNIELHPQLSITAIGGLKPFEKNSELWLKQFVEGMSRQKNRQQEVLEFSSQIRTGEIKLYDIKNKKWLELEIEKTVFETTALAFSEDGNYLAYGDKDGRVYMYELVLDEKSEISSVNPLSIGPLKFIDEFIWSLKFSLDNHWLAIATDSKLHLFNMKNQTIIKSEVNSLILSIGFSTNNQFLVTNARALNSPPHSFSLYEIKEKILKLAYTFKGHKNEVQCVAFSPKNDFIVSSGKDGGVIFWKIPTSADLLNFEKSQSAFKSEKFILYQFDNYFTHCEYLQFDKEGCLVICSNGILTRWKVEYNSDEEEKIRFMLLWSSDKPIFYAKGANYDGVKNISRDNRILLSQYRAKTIKDKEGLFDGLYEESLNSKLEEEAEDEEFYDSPHLTTFPRQTDLEEELFQMIDENDFDLIKEIVTKKDVNLNYNESSDGNGDPLLVHALNRGKIKIARLLIDAGADVNLGNDGSVREKFMIKTSLFCAIEAEFHSELMRIEFEEIPELLTEEDFNLKEGITALLIEKGAKCDKLIDFYGTNAALERLIYIWNGVSDNFQKEKNESKKEKYANLIEKMNNVFRLFIEHGAKMNMVDAQFQPDFISLYQEAFKEYKLEVDPHVKKTEKDAAQSLLFASLSNPYFWRPHEKLKLEDHEEKEEIDMDAGEDAEPPLKKPRK
jgi:WD40 repeat protein